MKPDLVSVVTAHMVYFCVFACSEIFLKNARKPGVGRGQFDAGVNGLMLCWSKNQIYGSIKFVTEGNLACLLRQFGSVNNPWTRLFCSVCFLNGSHMVSNKTLLVLQPCQVSCSLNQYNLTVLCNLLKTVQFARAL